MNNITTANVVRLKKKKKKNHENLAKIYTSYSTLYGNT